LTLNLWFGAPADLKRREFIALIGGLAAAWPLAARAQQSERTARIGILMGIGENDPEARPRAEALELGLSEHGWVKGRNLQLDYRWTAGDLDRTQRLAKDIVQLKPDLIVVHSTPAVKALLQLTTSVPMVFVLVADPIESGFVQSLSHPGSNITGFMNVDAPMAGKWLELIVEIAPKTRQVALIYNPNTAPFYKDFLSTFDDAAPKFNVRAISTPVTDAAAIEGAMKALGQLSDSALFVLPDVFVQVHRTLIIKLAAQYRVPAIYPYRFFPTSGGLLSYGIDTIAVFREAAGYADKILKGTAPNDLPVQAPSAFRLVVNLKAANAIDLKIPESFLLRADEVIE
jgi:putative tryptophan/tyrosine transport system substrate-binding protein